MEVIQTNHFKKSVKKLKKNQKADLDKAIQEIIKNPEAGIKKTGDLPDIHVYKFMMMRQEILLAYMHDADMITLLALGSHENFYRDLKRANKR